MSAPALVAALSAKAAEPQKALAVYLHCTVLLALSDFIICNVSTSDIAAMLISFSSELVAHKGDLLLHVDSFLPVLGRCCCLMISAEATTDFQNRQYLAAWKALLEAMVAFSSFAFEKSDSLRVDACKAALSALLQFVSSKETLKPTFCIISEELVRYTLRQLSIGRRGDENYVLIEILKSKQKYLESTNSAIRSIRDTNTEDFRAEMDHLTSLVATL